VTLDKVKIVDFPQVAEPRGNLSFIEGNNQIPFPIKRIYFLYDVPSGATRGGHSHRKLSELIIALSGSFDVILDDGVEKKKFFLNSPHYGLFIPPGLWREIENFSSNSVLLALASDIYDEKDYIRDYEVFKKNVASGNP
jgi:dTDP-4-dehydrorhamnose 3,5-epimerase-like enzyme